MFTYLLQNEVGQVSETHSISAGLDYPGVGPEHALLKDLKRVKYVGRVDDDAIEAFQLLSKLEGIIPALEPSHAISYAIELAKSMHRNETIIVTLSGRGDKDLGVVKHYLRMRDMNKKSI
jgi:tryptophan synthase beta chain